MKWALALLILAVMVVMAYPAFVTSRTHCGGRTCLSNVKQLNTGIQIYACDYDERFPLRDRWMDDTPMYTHRKDLYHCPDLVPAETKMGAYGYCYNGEMSGALPPVAPETVPLVFDSVNLARNASGPIDSLPNPGRYRGKSSVSFVDGHAKAVIP